MLLSGRRQRRKRFSWCPNELDDQLVERQTTSSIYVSMCCTAAESSQLEDRFVYGGFRSETVVCCQLYARLCGVSISSRDAYVKRRVPMEHLHRKPEQFLRCSAPAELSHRAEVCVMVQRALRWARNSSAWNAANGVECGRYFVASRRSCSAATVRIIDGTFPHFKTYRSHHHVRLLKVDIRNQT